jgi:two-component system LytT family sensor kinase
MRAMASTPDPRLRRAIGARQSGGDGLGRRVGLLLIVWSIPGLVATVQVHLQEAGPQRIGLARAAAWQMASWWAWVPLTFVVLGLLRRFPLDRAVLWRTIPTHLIAALALAVPHLWLSALAGRLAGVAYYQETALGRLVDGLYVRHVHLDILTYLAVLGAGAAWTFQRRLRAREVLAARLEARLVESELRALEMQLHPHFLFNTLNAIAVLVRKADGERALATLNALAELLRLTLSERGRLTVPLDREIELTGRYLELEQTRLGERLVVELDAPADALDAEVPTLVLQPLVENAIKHGIAPRSEGGRVSVRVWRQGARLHVEVVDDGVGLAASAAAGAATSGHRDRRGGVGLANVRARLAGMYPDDHTLAIADRDGGGTVVAIELPYRQHRDALEAAA